MTHQEFIEKYIRTAQDFDKAYGVQCVDLARLYAKEALNRNLGPFGGTALTGWQNKIGTFPAYLWTKVVNTPSAIPPQGAIIFYSFPKATGHVAIVHGATADDVLLIEQNGASGNGDGKGYNAINFEAKRDYKDCLGWYIKR